MCIVGCVHIGIQGPLGGGGAGENIWARVFSPPPPHERKWSRTPLEFFKLPFFLGKIASIPIQANPLIFRQAPMEKIFGQEST